MPAGFMPAETIAAELVRVGITNAFYRPLMVDIGTGVPGGKENNEPPKQGQNGVFLYLVSIVNGS